jgi:hypothetical protein
MGSQIINVNGRSLLPFQLLGAYHSSCDCEQLNQQLANMLFSPPAACYYIPTACYYTCS